MYVVSFDFCKKIGSSFKPTEIFQIFDYSCCLNYSTEHRNRYLEKYLITQNGIESHKEFQIVHSHIFNPIKQVSHFCFGKVLRSLIIQRIVSLIRDFLQFIQTSIKILSTRVCQWRYTGPEACSRVISGSTYTLVFCFFFLGFLFGRLWEEVLL